MHQQQEPRKISGGTVTARIVCVYLLSPFPVVWLITRIYGGLLDWPLPISRALQVFYAPLFYAASKLKPIADFYEWGMDLVDGR